MKQYNNEVAGISERYEIEKREGIFKGTHDEYIKQWVLRQCGLIDRYGNKINKR